MATRSAICNSTAFVEDGAFTPAVGKQGLRPLTQTDRSTAKPAKLQGEFAKAASPTTCQSGDVPNTVSAPTNQQRFENVSGEGASNATVFYFRGNIITLRLAHVLYILRYAVSSL